MISLRGKLEQTVDPETNYKKWEWRGLWAFGSIDPNLDLTSIPDHNKTSGEVAAEGSVALDGSLLSGPHTQHTRRMMQAYTSEQRQRGPLPFCYTFHGRRKVDTAPATTPGAPVSSEVKQIEVPSAAGVEDQANETGETKQNEATKADEQAQMMEPPPPQPKETISSSEEASQNLVLDEQQISNKYPPDGSWLGYFVNVTKKMDRSPLKNVNEDFMMEFRSSAPENTPYFFEFSNLPQELLEMTKQQEQGSGDSMKNSKFVHVKGTGSNQFGKFSIIGALDKDSMIMHCQRIYIREEVPGKKKPRGRGRPPKSATISSDVSPTISSMERKASDGPYYTRKRIMSWQQKRSGGDGIEVTPTSTTTAAVPATIPVPKRGRGRPPNNPSLTPHMRRISGPTSSNNIPYSDVFMTPDVASNNASKGAISVPGHGINSLAPPLNNKPGPHHIGGPSASKKLKFAELPPAGNPFEARWRSAHFFLKGGFYHDDQATSGKGNNLNNAAITLSSCVYEGDFDKGGCLREGMGVCLYGNGNIYEGQWRRDKEHGKGILMTGDRRYIIYDGEWERGRIHGKGIYNYHSINPMDYNLNIHGANTVDPSVFADLGVYEGEFKENMRHGLGKYTLVDGGVYEGEWSNNLRCGRGTFVWPDGSYYEGQWKDGKRHGNGLLKCSDGFTYEGQWVANSMDGRGHCVYPNGQSYEGLWSNGKKEGRGTIVFKNGAIYEGRFKADKMEGAGGTLKIPRNVQLNNLTSREADQSEDHSNKSDWWIPIEFQSDMGHIHRKAGFTNHGD